MNKNYSIKFVFSLLIIVAEIMGHSKKPLFTANEVHKIVNFLEEMKIPEEVLVDRPTVGQLNVSQSKTPESDIEIQSLHKSINLLKIYTECMVNVISFIDDVERGNIKDVSESEITQLRNTTENGGGYHLLNKSLIMLRWLEDNQCKCYSREVKEEIEKGNSQKLKEQYEEMTQLQRYFLLKNIARILVLGNLKIDNKNDNKSK